MEVLGMEDSVIADSQITRSSGSIAPPGPRLHSKGYWIDDSPDSKQWLQINLFRQTNITGVILMGNPSSNYYVTRYRVETCLDGASWENVTDENDDVEVLSYLTISYQGGTAPLYLIFETLRIFSKHKATLDKVFTGTD